MTIKDVKYIIELLKRQLNMTEISIKHADTAEQKDKLEECDSITSIIKDLNDQTDNLPICFTIAEKPIS